MLKRKLVFQQALDYKHNYVNQIFLTFYLHVPGSLYNPVLYKMNAHMACRHPAFYAWPRYSTQYLNYTDCR